MNPIRYKARILPDGHLPVPDGLSVRAGDEVEVTLQPAEGLNGSEDPQKRAEYLLKTWAGIGRGRGSGIAEHHDDPLYPRG